MNKRRLLFIINPISGVGKQKTIETLADKYLNKSMFDYSFEYTNAPKHATEISRKAAEDGVDFVVVVGGDGSINEVGKGLLNSNTAMGIIPTGSGNGFARHLNLPLDIKKAVQLLNNSSIVSIDTGILNDENLFLGISGTGFDAFIGKKFNELQTRGLLSYIKLIKKEVRSFNPIELEFEIDHQHISGKFFIAAICNSSQYGNNAHIAPRAKLNDGILNVTLIKKFPSFALIPILFKLFKKKIYKSKYVEEYTCKSVVIKGQDLQMHIDGEPIECNDKASIKVLPQSLNVLVDSSFVNYI